MHKKIIFVFLLLIPSVALASFPDVHSNNPFFDAIIYVQQKGIVSGKPNGQFSPDAGINRAEFLKILVKAKYSDKDIQECSGGSFKDVTPDQWYAGYVCLAKKMGIINGYPDGTFQADNYVTFAEASKIIRNTLLTQDPPPPNSSFTQWYQPYVAILAAHNAIPTSIDGFDTPVSRGEMVEMIYRIDAKITNKSSLDNAAFEARALIESYYDAIAGGHYQQAYDMKIDNAMSLEAFKKLYQDFPTSRLESFNKSGASSYDYTVMTTPMFFDERDKNMRVERYKVNMQVVGGKLKTLSSSTIDNDVLETVTNGDKTATLEWDHGVYKIYVTLNKVKTFVTQFDTKGEYVKALNLQFSPTGNFLTYEKMGYESVYTGLYDVWQKKEVGMYFGNELYGFSSQDENFYFCSQGGIGNGVVKVENLFSNVSVQLFNENTDDIVVGCGPYDNTNRLLHYRVKKSGAGEEEIKYLLQ